MRACVCSCVWACVYIMLFVNLYLKSLKSHDVGDCTDHKVSRLGKPPTDHNLVDRLWETSSLPYISCCPIVYVCTLHLYSVLMVSKYTQRSTTQIHSSAPARGQGD